MNHRRLLPILAGSASLLLAGPEAARACGGFFCTTAPMDQAGELILFAARDGVVTTHVQIQYSGEAADFAWVLPVPSPPEVGVSRDELFSELEFATRPVFSLEVDWSFDTCGPQVEDFLGGCSTCAQTDGYPVEVVARDRVGPYESVVITAEDAGAVVDWLTDNGYQLGDTGPELLAPYTEEGYYFLALRLAPDRGVGDLVPVALTYKAERPGIPIRLTAVAVQPDMPVFVWILGDHRAVPVNYRHVHVNEARLDWIFFGSNYSQLVTAAAGEAGGRAFATDFAGSSEVMDRRLYFEGRFDIDRLRGIEEAPDLIDSLFAQRFPGDSQMQALLRRHLPMPDRVLEEGVLQVVYAGDQDAYDLAVEEGRLLSVAEDWFYNSMREFSEYIEGEEYDLEALLDELEAVVVEPLKAAQALFDEYPYLTRLYTTLSADEMTLDPMFDFNPDLPEVSRWRQSAGSIDCNLQDGLPQWEWQDWTLVLELADGRVLRAQPWVDSPQAMPAAALIEQLHTSGPPEIILRPTLVEEVGSASGPARFTLGKNYPNPFNSKTVIPFRVSMSEGEQADATLRIFNGLGQPVSTVWKGKAEAGESLVHWDGLDASGRPVPSGTYLYQLEAGSIRMSRKLTVLR